MNDLPDAIRTIHQAAQREGTEADVLDSPEQSLWFAYRRPDGQLFGLALVRGPVPPPAIGQTVTLWTKDVPLRVIDVQTHYGLRINVRRDDQTPIASTVVIVDSSEKTS